MDQLPKKVSLRWAALRAVEIAVVVIGAGACSPSVPEPWDGVVPTENLSTVYEGTNAHGFLAIYEMGMGPELLAEAFANSLTANGFERRCDLSISPPTLAHAYRRGSVDWVLRIQAVPDVGLSASLADREHGIADFTLYDPTDCAQ